MPFATAPKPPVKYFAVSMQDDKIVQSLPAEIDAMRRRVYTTIFAVLSLNKLVLTAMFQKQNSGRKVLAAAANANHPFVWRLDVKILQCNARPILTVWPRKRMWRGYTVLCECRWTGAIIEVDVGPTAQHCMQPIFDVHPSEEGSTAAVEPSSEG